MAGDGGEGEGLDELLGGGGHDDVGVEAGVLEEADEVDGLVGRDAAADSYGDLDGLGAHVVLRVNGLIVVYLVFRGYPPGGVFCAKVLIRS